MKYKSGPPFFDSTDIKYILKTYKNILKGKGTLRMGNFVNKFELQFAKYIGSNNKEKANSTAEHLIISGILIGFFITILYYFIADDLILLQGASIQEKSYALDYFYTMISGTTFMILGVFFRSILLC